MIQLDDDAALCRLAIAASAVPPHERGDWLRKFAERIDPPSPPRRTSSAAARQWRARQRAREGLRIFRLECDHDRLVLALIESQRISEGDALDHCKVEHAAAELLDDFAKRFLAGIR